MSKTTGPVDAAILDAPGFLTRQTEQPMPFMFGAGLMLINGAVVIGIWVLLCRG